VLFRAQPRLVVFMGCQQNDEGWYEMQCVTAIQPEWLTELAPGVFKRA
jgi:ATP-dependent RNA helicase DDX35